MNKKRISRIPAPHRRAVEADIRRIAEAIRMKRKALDLTQEELSERVGITTTTLQSIEQNRRLPSISLLFAIFRELKINFKVEQ